ncbi:MAG: DUF3108 domain-containing protein [Candidatus Omnitrophota bacterium]
MNRKFDFYYLCMNLLTWRGLKRVLLAGVLLFTLAAFLKNALLDTPKGRLLATAKLQEKLKSNRAETNVFDQDKRFFYRIYYFALIPMGRLSFQTQASGEETHCVIEATSQGSIAQFFVQARARLQSDLDKKTRQTVKYSEQTIVNGEVKTKEIVFDHGKLLATRDGAKIRIPEQTHDPLGAFLTTLALPLDFGVQKMVLFLTKEVIYAMRSEVVRVENGIVELLLDAHRLDRSSNHGTTMRIWMTDDSLRIPLVFKSWTPAGFFSAVLEKAE